MKLNVCKEIASVHVNGKTIAYLQPHVSPGRYDIKKLQANEIDFENCLAHSISKTQIAKRFNLLHFWPCVPPFVFAIL